MAALLLIAAILFSCKTTEEIDAKNVDIALVRHKDATVAKVNAVSPCTTSVGSIKSDSTAFKEKVNQMQRLIDFWKNKPPRTVKDTVNVPDSIKANYYKGKWAECEETVKSMNVFIVGLTDDFNNIPAIHDTLPPIIDNRKVDLLQGQLNTEIANHKADLFEAQKLESHANTQNIFKNWLMIILLILGLVTGFFIGNKIPKI
jgi:hypothetical protein